MLAYWLDIKDDQFDLPPFEQLLKFKVVVCGCLDAGILVNARATNMELMRAETSLHMAIHPNGVGDWNRHQIFPHWSHLVIDEVSRMLYSLLYNLTSV